MASAAFRWRAGTAAVLLMLAFPLTLVAASAAPAAATGTVVMPAGADD